MPSRSEFAATLKAKYPAYKDVPDDQLVDAMLAKYPVYKSQVDSGEASSDESSRFAVRALAQSADPLFQFTHRTPPPTDEAGRTGEHEPTTYMGGFLKSIEQDLLKVTAGNPLLQGAAHPSSIGDVASLLLPDSAAVGKAASSIPLKRIARSVGGVIQDYDITHPVKPLGDLLKWMGAEKPPVAPMSAESAIQPLAADLGPDAVRHGPSQYARGAYQTPAVDKPAPPMDIGRLTGQKAPTLEDSLLEALRSAGGSERPEMASSHTPLDPVGSPVSQSGKFGRSGSLGQPGGYTSGLPAISDAEYDAMLKKFGGKAQTHALLPGDASLSVDATDWHSGAEPGSAEAKSAQSLHKATGEMDSSFKAKMDDPLATLLLTALLGGGSASALQSSHGGQ